MLPNHWVVSWHYHNVFLIAVSFQPFGISLSHNNYSIIKHGTQSLEPNLQTCHVHLHLRLHVNSVSPMFLTIVSFNTSFI